MLSAEYIVGLVDGEGSFNVRSNALNRRRAKVEMKFCLKLISKDKEILDELKKFFGCGNVYIQNDKRPNHSTCFRYEVQNRKEIMERIIPFFEKNPLKLKSKKNDFELFRQIAELVKANADKTEKGLEKINALKNNMH